MATLLSEATIFAVAFCAALLPLHLCSLARARAGVKWPAYGHDYAIAVSRPWPRSRQPMSRAEPGLDPIT